MNKHIIVSLLIGTSMLITGCMSSSALSSLGTQSQTTQNAPSGASPNYANIGAGLGKLLGSLLEGTTLNQKDIVGTWRYSGANCVFETENLLMKAGGEIAATKVEEKINASLAKIIKESPCVELRRNHETKQLLIGGLSDTHLVYIAEKLKNTYDVSVILGTPKIVYRETIKGINEATGRYVKQSGGSGHFGVVVMRFEPSYEEENKFAEEVFGGAVPKNFFPAVEKGFVESTLQGLLAGFPVVGMKATLLDGKYHPVDSDELSFKMAAILAYKEAYLKCKPTILEPIMKIVVSVENQFIGDILSDLQLRRGRVLEMKELGDDTQDIIALVPESEILDYATKLRLITQGSGYFNREFDSFQEVPQFLQEKVLKENSLLNK